MSTTLDNIGEKIRDVLSGGRTGVCLRWDYRNHYLVYNPNTASAEFRELSTFLRNAGSRFFFPYQDFLGNPVTFELVSEEEWSRRDLGTVPSPKVGPEYFDQDYYRQSVKSCFDGDYTWERYEEHTAADTEMITNRFNPKRVLDAGCAKGFLCKSLLRRGIEVNGFDISKWAIDNCEPEVKGRLIHFIADGLTPWPYKDGSYDLVTSISMMEHMEPSEIPFCLKEIYRITTNWALIAVPVSITRNNSPWGDPTHKCFMSLDWWIAEGLKAGFLFNWQRTNFDVTKNEGTPYAIAQVYIAFQKDRLELVTQRRTLKYI